MDMTYENNSVLLCGHMADRPCFSHSSRGQDFYSFPLEIPRLSGNYDILNILARPNQLENIGIESGDKLHISGQLRTFNNRKKEGAKLIITVLAKEIELADSDYKNSIVLHGTLCKKPNLRCTPMGREICDLMLAVNRRYGRSDYIPCICWGNRARAAADWDVGTKLDIEGRIQSRKYIKLIDSVAFEKTAYEVSVTEAQEVSADSSYYVNNILYT